MSFWSSLFGKVSPATRHISHRGGLVEFDVPARWVEEDEGGTFAFYEERADSGTLRLTVLTFERDDDPGADSKVLDGGEVRPDGLDMQYSLNFAEESGHELELHQWEIAVPVLPKLLRVAVFTYTILRGQQDDPRIAAELETVKELIGNAVFSRE